LREKNCAAGQIYPLRMSDVPNLRFSPAEPGKIAGPGFLRGTFSLAATGDTYLKRARLRKRRGLG
jgi:hypothetical protein